VKPCGDGGSMVPACYCGWLISSTISWGCNLPSAETFAVNG